MQQNSFYLKSADDASNKSKAGAPKKSGLSGFFWFVFC